jgi:ribosomal protein S18 acetylase RimI-like enzyme
VTTAVATAEVTLRPVGPADAEFLLRVYASTRSEELAPVPWSSEQKDAFLRQQFEAQGAYWRETYPKADFAVVEVDGGPAGRLYVNRGPDEIRLVDIALLPEYRRGGIGTGLIRELLAEAETRSLPVTIHVEVFNPARALYERLGFEWVADRGAYVLMQWRPAAARGAVS